MCELYNSSADELGGKTAVTVLLLAVGIVLVLTVAWMGRVILLLLFAALILACLQSAIVTWVMKKLKLGRKMTFALIMLVGTALVTIALWVSGPDIIDQFQSLQSELPQAFQQSVAHAKEHNWGRWVLSQWSGYSQLSSSTTYAVTQIGGFVLTTASLVTGMVIIVFLGLYLAAEPEVYYAGLRRVIPKNNRATFDGCAFRAVHMIRSWLFAQMLSMVAIGLLVTIGLWLLGVPLAGTLGIIAALLTFIPNFGAILSVVPAALLAFAISPVKGLLTIFLFMAVHFVEGNIITPLLQRKIVRLPPALTLIAQLLLAVIAGPLGFALAAPLTAATMGVFQVLFPSDTAPPEYCLTGNANLCSLITSVKQRGKLTRVQSSFREIYPRT
jgi:predicted PurR-regulated permease PerM